MKSLKNRMKKCVALGAAFAMVATAMPLSNVAQAAGEDDGLVLWYNFESLKSGTILNDMSGNGRAGVIRPTGSQVTTTDANIYGTDYTTYDFQGETPSAENTYVELPAGVFNGLEDMTVSCWVNLDVSGGGYQRIWDFGFKADGDNFNTTSYMYLIADGANQGHVGYTAAITDSGWGNEKGPEKQVPLET